MTRVAALVQLPGHGERWEIRLDDGRTLDVSYEVLTRAGVGRGDELDEDRLRTLADEDVAWRAREAALNLLSYRARSRVELARRLARRAFPPDVVERCLDALEERGLLDDRAFSESFARDRVRGKPKGARRIAQELRARGVDPEIAEDAIREAMAGEGASEVDLALQAAARWRRKEGEDPQRAGRRLHAFLARRGFGGEVIRAVLQERTREW